MSGKLFLSHAHADKPAVQILRRALEDSGVPVWEDVLGLLLLWTPAADEFEWVKRETARARQAGGDPDHHAR